MKSKIAILLLGVAMLSPIQGFSQYLPGVWNLEPTDREKRHKRRLKELANSDAFERVYQLEKTSGALRFPNLEYLLQYRFSNLEDVAITSFRQGRSFHDLMSSEYDEYVFNFSAQVDGIEENFSCQGTLFFSSDNQHGHWVKWVDEHNVEQLSFYQHNRMYFNDCESENVALARFSIKLRDLGVKERSSRDGKRVLRN